MAADLFGLFTSKKSRLQEAIQKDNGEELDKGKPKLRWYSVITPQTLAFMCNSNFLNRTKASLRLNYEPIFNPEESFDKSLNWYKNHLRL